MEFGEWLAAERESVGLSQHDLARESGVTQSTISDIEAGKRGAMSRTLRAVRRMVATLGISLLEAYLHAGLLETDDERDRDAIAAALMIREMDSAERRELLETLRGKG